MELKEIAASFGDGDGSGYGYGDGSGYGYGSGSGYGYGDGYGDGSGYGSGYGSGDGSGYGYGDGSGDGYGYGDGSGYGYGSGSGYGDGYGYGDGSGDGSGYGYGDGSGYGYGDGSGDGYGSGYGDAPKEYASAILETCAGDRAKTLKKAGCTLAFWKSDKKGKACNGGASDPKKPGDVDEIPGPLKLCTAQALHATLKPWKWKGEKLWVVALYPPVEHADEDKMGALKREYVAEVPNFFRR